MKKYYFLSNWKKRIKKKCYVKVKYNLVKFLSALDRDGITSKCKSLDAYEFCTGI